ncbi:MAG: hypothetical protein FD124_3258 [Alphaproteobacteria bacterium]|nr:MAG: hypothetical protein FD124_3258 [Alphaproteobacteria bacterium]
MTGIEADYLVIGAGAMAMGFVDQLLTDGDSTVVMVDRRHAPGGHWIDGYAFLRLHQPAAYYGVNSRPLDSGARDEQGPNAGLIELASRDQVVGYYDAILNQRFLPSGRVRFFPMTVHEGGGEIVSRLTGERRTVRARRVVDATHLSPSIPAHHTPDFEVAPGAACIRVNDLPALARPGADYVLVGAGKTGMDTALWLLENGVGPARIRWIMPRDSWMLDRAHYQPGQEHLGEVLDTLANEVEAIVESTSLEDLFERLEAKGCRLRLDPSVTPTIHRCATVSKGELALMRTITDVVRSTSTAPPPASTIDPPARSSRTAASRCSTCACASRCSAPRSSGTWRCAMEATRRRTRSARPSSRPATPSDGCGCSPWSCPTARA